MQGRTATRMHDGQWAMTQARWPTASGAKNCLLTAILLFPHCFQKSCTADTLKQGHVWERVKALWGKGENAGTSIFSFSLNVFYPF